MICAVGGADRLVGRTEVCNYPSNLLAQVPIVAGFGRPYIEPVLAQKPTCVVATDLENRSLGETLDRLGIPLHRIPCRRMDEIPGAIETIGAIVGRTEVAGALAKTVRSGIRIRREAAARTQSARRPLVFVEIWGDPLLTAGSASFVSEMVALAGGRNLGDEVARDYATVSTEWVLEHNPDVILCLFHGADRRARQIVMARTGWQAVRAVQNGRVYDQFDLDTILRPGPRVLDGVEQLRQAIDPQPNRTAD